MHGVDSHTAEFVGFLLLFYKVHAYKALLISSPQLCNESAHSQILHSSVLVSNQFVYCCVLLQIVCVFRFGLLFVV